MEINLYPEMNSKISDLLRLSEEPTQIYAAALIDAYRAPGLEPDEIPQWIPVSERLPEESGGDENGEVLIYKGGEKWITKVLWVKDEDATHWMPLPQPPKEEK